MKRTDPRRDAVHPIGEAASRLGVHPRTLMAYERMGLVKPARRSNRRIYSGNDLRWLACLKEFNRSGVSFAGVAILLRFVPCWAIRAELEDPPGERCCPPSYPGASCRERAREAHAGRALAACRDCGNYRAAPGGRGTNPESVAA